MSLQSTPQSSRYWIGLFGRRNSGKSTLMNLLCDQPVSLVSAEAGTTTDPVTKSIEIKGLGPVVLVDTAGYDDVGHLGQARVERSEASVDRVHFAVLLLRPSCLLERASSNSDEVPSSPDWSQELAWIRRFAKQKAPWLLAVNLAEADLKAGDGSDALLPSFLEKLRQEALPQPSGQILLDLHCAEARQTFVQALLQAVKASQSEQCDSSPASLTASLCGAGDHVLLVMPQDIQAPAGRLILPQVQTIRELLDKHCFVSAVTANEYPAVLSLFQQAPSLIITDSQVFPHVWAHKPAESRVTSFSILMAAFKGDIELFRQGAEVLPKLGANSRVLIAEACSHVPLQEDIGRVKIPRLLRDRISPDITIDIMSGNDWPSAEKLASYDLVIHCGACMFNRPHVLARLRQLESASVPITNYGIALAWFAGILDKVALPL